MISVEQALKVHTTAIEKFGGGNGVRDTGGLKSVTADDTFLSAKKSIAVD